MGLYTLHTEESGVSISTEISIPESGKTGYLRYGGVTGKKFHAKNARGQRIVKSE
jgi:hypothetical protein